MTRDRLPNRRRVFNISVRHDQFGYHAGYSLYEDGPRKGQLQEVFIVGGKPGSPVEAMARDTGLILSLLLQHGATAAEVLASLSKLDHDEAAGPAGVILEQIVEAERAAGNELLAVPITKKKE